jgi:hypothetical protein
MAVKSVRDKARGEGVAASDFRFESIPSTGLKKVLRRGPDVSAKQREKRAEAGYSFGWVGRPNARLREKENQRPEREGGQAGPKEKRRARENWASGPKLRKKLFLFFLFLF